MKVALISDTHLSPKFYREKFEKLKEIITDSDKVIINGDFWDNNFTNFEKFVNSKWSQLFELLLSKDTIYLYGNHDPLNELDERYKLFSKELKKSIEVKIGKNNYHITHGDNLLTYGDGMIWRILAHNFMSRLINYAEKTSLHLSKNFVLDKQRKTNGDMRKWLHENLLKGEYLVCGHSHIQEYNPDEHYFNTGLFNHNLIQYGILSDSGIQLFDENY